MNSEKVKEIKYYLEQSACMYGNMQKQALTLINELESENKTFLESKTMWKRLHTEVCEENKQLKDENETIKFNMQETEKASFNINQMNGNLVIENKQLKDRIAELEEYIKGNEQDAKAFVNGWHKDLKTELKQFAERLKEKFYYVFGNEYEQSVSGFDTKVLIEYVDETLKEFIDGN